MLVKWQTNFLCIFFILSQTENTSGTIKEQLATIAPVLEQLWQQKEERIKEFLDAQGKKQRLHKVMHLEHFFSLIFIYAIVVKYISSQMLGILIYCGFCFAILFYCIVFREWDDKYVYKQ